ncbi:MAG: hypothetical protein A2268_11550 [Candidatus Raymondbacteria bacterium RifOxyA12_full_50_37]|uniref:PilZ domain-containing protein n=1 Tax=Candidatus Raymondbacteria bacterium RIFOXYD12_FULL_49_13 TaxID=1817890 RepID=A0A1F7FAE4_UNCRA|nr:MAG: hypothetical protein A2268_11550 [Candidatus Raymondbacteria bacterium RifOxyA12_full_50_37]OGJ92403.1 MAG: hypothetical protein A2248_10675 [Candidatus Raymondbacteria bacterium RIFOXYA2_FULL_49_16]OGJ99384.1 MAG: hypothetical protein A2453_13740 [Candidatus Raymondbacteria bacterium RIFOXYC2_FULL_50_21]OGK03603.1 MAG: hypothetical protein A2519_02385 [Candidatus Raymondbacteria bacterium RIFOXYD12_FULL_49_13]OGP44296.1 MAG: hypothetical protein A2324_05065 [Candidatus Raymondbacteria 
MEDKKIEEKRTSIRIPFVYDIEFDDADQTTLALGGFFTEKNTPIKINDISADGLQVAVPDFLAKGTKVKLSLKFPRWRGVSKEIVEENTECVVTAKIQWITKDRTGGFRAGLMFINLTSEARHMIYKYLEDHISITDEML